MRLRISIPLARHVWLTQSVSIRQILRALNRK